MSNSDDKTKCMFSLAHDIVKVLKITSHYFGGIIGLTIVILDLLERH